MRVRDFCTFIEKREFHRMAKEAGGYTKIKPRRRPDNIIANYRFCNVRRNDDRVTKWIFDNYMDRWAGKKHLWFALTVARLFNKENTLAQIEHLVLPFDPSTMRRRLVMMRAHGPIFNGAYIVSTNGRKMDKVDYIIDLVLTPLWEKRKEIGKAIKKAERLTDVHEILQAEQGLGSFMAAQVLADLKYIDPTKWRDFHTFAASGPGSRRGLNRVMNTLINTPWREVDFRATLAKLREETNARLGWEEPITAQDIQNCLCEFDKYERVRLDEGKPKQKYKTEF